MDASQLRPLGVGEIIDAGIRITRSRFRDLAILVGIIVIPAQVVQFFVAISAPGSEVSFGFSPTPESGATEASDALTQLAATLVSLVIGLLTAWLATAACTEIVSSTYLGGRAGWRESLRKAWNRFVSLVGANLLILVITGVGLLACFFPGVWLYIAFTVAVPAIIVEGIRGPASLRRSFRLVRGRWWSVFAIVLVSQLLAAIVQGFVALPMIPVLLAAGGDSTVVTYFATGVSTVVGTVLTQPFIAALVVIIYYDLRVRREGFDLALMVQQLDAPPPPVTTSRATTEGAPLMPEPPDWHPTPPPGWEPPE